MSFGRKHGLISTMDDYGWSIIDCRDIRNPYNVPDLKHLNGRAFPVQQYVYADPAAMDALARAWELVTEGHTHIAFGCFGGEHRSVALAEAFRTMLAAVHKPTMLTHRELDK